MPKAHGKMKNLKSTETDKKSPSQTLPNIKQALLKQALLKHYTQTPAHLIFQRFKLGAMLFFLGLVIIYGGYQLLDESLVQEIVVLIGVILIGGGFLLAMLAQIRLLIGRLIHIFFH